jgi:hypothetical protein
MRLCVAGQLYEPACADTREAGAKPLKPPVKGAAHGLAASRRKNGFMMPILLRLPGQFVEAGASHSAHGEGSFGIRPSPGKFSKPVHLIETNAKFEQRGQWRCSVAHGRRKPTTLALDDTALPGMFWLGHCSQAGWRFGGNSVCVAPVCRRKHGNSRKTTNSNSSAPNPTAGSTTRERFTAGAPIRSTFIGEAFTIVNCTVYPTPKPYTKQQP